ncbi:hypothetical protein ACLOJK_040858, partial [Asimina triloba]
WVITAAAQSVFFPSSSGRRISQSLLSSFPSSARPGSVDPGRSSTLPTIHYTACTAHLLSNARRCHCLAHAHARRRHRLAHAHARRCHRLARADCRVVDHASASTASAIACPLPDAPCRFIATICLLPAPSIN